MKAVAVPRSTPGVLSGLAGKVRGWAANAGLALGSTILMLAALEGGARVYVHRHEGAPGTLARPPAEFDPELGWVKPKGLTAIIHRAEFRIQETVNAHGLRGPDRPYEKPAGVHRVLLLGDSFTEAATVEEAETVRAVLERRLDAHGPRRHEVINAGTAGYSTDQEYLFYVREGTRYHADVVVVIFYYNDLYGVLGSEGGKPYFELKDGALVLRNSPVPPPPPGWGRDRRSRYVLRPWHGSQLLRLASLRTARGHPELHRVLARWGITEPYGESVTPPEMWPYGLGHLAEVGQMWRLVGTLLGALREHVRADGAQLVLLYAPAAFECDERAWDLTRRRYGLGRRWDRDRVAEGLARTAAELGLPVVDPRPQLRAAHAAGRRPYYAIDGHWTAVGNAVAGEELERAMHALNLEGP